MGSDISLYIYNKMFNKMKWKLVKIIQLVQQVLQIYIYLEGNGTPLQYSCLENPMDGAAW